MNERLNELLGLGLQEYFRGNLQGALQAWEEALRLAPDDSRAREYVRFARQSLGGGAPVAVAPAPVSAAPAASTAVPRPALSRPPSMQRLATPPRGTTMAAAVAPQPAAEAPPAAPAVRLAPAPPQPESPWDDGPSARGAVELAPPTEDPIALDLVEEPRPRPAPPSAKESRRAEVENMLRGARDLFALADFSGSLELIEKVLALDPDNAEAKEYLVKNRDTLTQMYESQIGRLDAVPKLAIPPDEVIWLSLDHRAGFVLSQIDGQASFEDLFALSGLPRLETARILAKLVTDGVIKPSKR